VGKYIFNEIFKEIVDTFYIDNAILGEMINRDSSRIRHYKLDGKPSKIILDKLISSLCEIIYEKNDDYINLIFMEHTKELIQSKELFTDEIRQKLSIIQDINIFISLLLRKSLECSVASSLIANSSSMGSKISLGNHRLTTQVNQAHQYFENNLYPEAVSIYEELLSTDQLFELPILKKTIYTDLGLIYRNYALSKYDSILLKKAIYHFDIAAILSLDTEDLLNYGLVNKYLGTAYTFLYNFEDSENNLKKSYEYYDIALSALQDVNNPEEQSKVHINYGILFIYHATIRNSRDFLGNSISYFNKAINYFDANSIPYFKALASMNCSGSYTFLAELCNTKIHTTQAITMVQQALEVFTIEDYPLLYASCISTLGHIYYVQATCTDTITNCHKAINYIMHALTIATKEIDANTYLIAHLNLSATYILLGRNCDIEENTEKAIQSLEICNNYYNELSNSINNLKTNLNYAELLIEIGELKHDMKLLKESEKILVNVVELCENMNFSYYKSITNYNLARIYYLYYKTNSQEKFLKQTSAITSKTLEIFTVHDYPLNYAHTMHLVAKIHECTGEYDEQKQAYENVLSIITKEAYPVKYDIVIDEYMMMESSM